MNEDPKLEAVVREALEEGASLGDGQRRRLLAEAAAAARRRRVRGPFARGRAPTLLAASLAVSLAVVAVFREAAGNGTDEMADAIGLLCELEGVEGDELSAASPGELLLSWQEAPCADLFL